MTKILVVDDEFRIRQIIRKYAEFEGYEVEEAVDGMQAIEICRKKEFDLIIMDVMMPELDGFSACREIRKFRNTPIIMLSARGEEYKGLEVDFTARIVSIDGKRVEMTPKEYDLFFYMVRNKGIALTRESLISEVWGYDFFGDERTLDTHIKLLRKSLGEYSKCIVTLRGVGYRFETD